MGSDFAGNHRQNPNRYPNRPSKTVPMGLVLLV
jgi:hypothetical protein